MPRNNNENLDREKKKLFKKKLNKSLNSYFKWFVFFVVLIIFIFGFFKLIIPQYEETVRMADIITKQGEIDVEEKRKELEDIKNFLLAFSRLDPRYIEKINSVAPDKYNKEELFTELNHIVANSGLLLQSIEIGNPEAYSMGKSELAGDLRKITINISVRGTDYKAFKNFLSSLENNLKLIDVTTVSFDHNSMSTRLIINTYYLQ